MRLALVQPRGGSHQRPAVGHSAGQRRLTHDGPRLDEDVDDPVDGGLIGRREPAQGAATPVGELARVDAGDANDPPVRRRLEAGELPPTPGLGQLVEPGEDIVPCGRRKPPWQNVPGADDLGSVATEIADLVDSWRRTSGCGTWPSASSGPDTMAPPRHRPRPAQRTARHEVVVMIVILSTPTTPRSRAFDHA
jgi:hypothetical protein